MAGPSIVARFTADTSAMTGEIDKATSGAGSKIGSFAKGAAVAIGGAFAVDKVVDFAKQSIDAASNLQEATSKVGVVFGKSSDDVVKWSKTSAESMGLSQRAALEAAGTYGNLAVALGLPEDQAASMSKSLVGLAADMASFNNVPVDEALNALKSGLTGETEPLKAFGVNINDAALKAEALSMGLVQTSVDADKLSAAQETLDKATRKTADALKEHGKGSTEFKDAARDQMQAQSKVNDVMAGDTPKSLTAAQKAQASYSLIMKQSSTAQGDFARTSDGLANSTKTQAAKMEEFQAKIGEKLLPVMTLVVGFIADDLLPALESIGGWIGDNADVFAALGIAIGVVGTAILISLVPALIAALPLMIANAAASIALAAPWIALVAVVVAVAAAIYLLWNNWDTVLNALKVAVNAVWQAIQTAWDAIVNATKAAWDAVWGAIKFVWDWIKANWPLLLGIITGPIGIAVAMVVTHWDTVKAAATAVWQWVVGKWNAITSGISSAVGAIGSWISTLVGYFSRVKDAATQVWQWVSDKFNAMKDAISNVVGGIASAIGRVADAIKRPINAVIGAWNNLEFRIPTFTLPSVEILGQKIGGQTFGGQSFGFPNLPTLAAGGVLTQPTLFIGGEAGTEIVAPEAMLRAIVSEESGGHYELNIYPRTADSSDIAYGFRRLELLAGIA